MSKWKAGQIVTIEGKVYRVTKLDMRLDGCCIFCGFRFKECDEYPCVECISSGTGLIPYNSYLKEIKPKS